MGIKVAWDNVDNTIIRYDLEGLWSWDDYRAAVSRSAEMIQSVDSPVGIIANFHADTMVPKASPARSASSIQPLEKMSAMPDKMDVVVITGGHAFVEVTVTGFCKTYNRVPKKFLAAGSLDEARRIIKQRRTTKN